MQEGQPTASNAAADTCQEQLDLTLTTSHLFFSPTWFGMYEIDTAKHSSGADTKTVVL